MLEKIVRKHTFRNLFLSGLAAFSLGACSDYSLDVSSIPPDTKDPEVSGWYSNDSSNPKEKCEVDSKKYCQDSDKDDFGNPKKCDYFCKKPKDYVENDGDCDDTNPKINPFGIEVCNSLDDNCNGKTDEDLDKECDSICGKGQELCIAGKYQLCNAPLPSKEICDGIDNNCNGITDEGLEFKMYYQDKDGDSWGNVAKKWCTLPKGYVERDGDCDDDDPKINPDAKEICNNKDDNCDGIKDKIFDVKNCLSYDLIFIIDNSGSMSSNDPDKYRYKGLNELISNNWQVDDRGLVIPFSTDYKVIGTFSSDPVQLLKNIALAEKNVLGGATYLGKAFSEGVSQFQKKPKKRAIIVLTDGGANDNPYIYPSQLNLLATKNNVNVCALGFGQADKSYLQTLTSGVGGYVFISKPDEIPQFFVDSYYSLKCETYQECSLNNEWKPKSTINNICGVKQ
jgi:hypothetical protein